VGAVPGGPRERVLLPEARRHVGAGGAPAHPHPGEEEGRRVPDSRGPAGPGRAGADRDTRDPHLERGGRAPRGAGPPGVRSGSRRRRALARRRCSGSHVAGTSAARGARELSQDDGREGSPSGGSNRARTRLGRLPRVRALGRRDTCPRLAEVLHGRRLEERAPRAHLPRLPAQPARRDGDRRLLHTRPAGRAGLDTAGVGRARGAHPLRSLHRLEPSPAARVAAPRPMEGLRDDPPDAAGGRAVRDVAPRRIFLLSPASCAGQRARMLFNPQASFELARGVRTSAGVPLGQVFSFLSGLYFRGKLEYASTWACPPDGTPGVFVMTAGDGLCLPQTRVGIELLERWAATPIDLREPRYTEPLLRDARTLASSIDDRPCEIVLLGSVATGKYVDLLQEAFGARLVCPMEFVGR